MNWKNFLKPGLTKILITSIFALPIILGLFWGGTSEFYLGRLGIIAIPSGLVVYPIWPLVDKIFSMDSRVLAWYISSILLLVYYYIFACLAVFIFEKISGKIGKKQTILILISIGIIAGSIYSYFGYEKNKSVEQRTVEKCEKIKERDSRNECYFNIARSWLAGCDKVQEEYKDDCYKIRARGLCGAIRKQDQKDDCYKIMAEISKQSSLCGSIIDTQIKERCYQSAGAGTAGWKTHRNEEYGYEIKYPQDWKIVNVDWAAGKEYVQFLSPLINNKYYFVLNFGARNKGDNTQISYQPDEDWELLKSLMRLGDKVKIGTVDILITEIVEKGKVHSILYSNRLGAGGVEISGLEIQANSGFIEGPQHLSARDVESIDLKNLPELKLANQILSTFKFIEK